MYIAAYLTALCGYYAAYVGLDIGEPLFLVVVLVLTTVGYTVSYITRTLPSASWSIAALAGSAVGVLALRSLATGSSSGLFPAATDGEVQKNLGVILCWLLVLLSYAQLARGWLLFSCVPTAAIMGLVGTGYAEADFLAAFSAFVLLGTFLLVYDQQSRMRTRRRPDEPASPTPRLLGQLYVAALCGLGAVMVGRIIAHPMQALGSGLGYPVVPAEPLASSRTSTGSAPISVSERTDMFVGVGAPPSATDETLVMRVRAEHGAYWRGATFDVFTGRGWRNSLSKDSAGPVPSRGAPSALFDPRDRASLDIEVPITPHNRVPGPSHIMNQYVYLEVGARFGELYGAAEPRLYRLAENATFGLRLEATADASGSVSLSRPIAGTVYEVQSEIPEWDESTLRQRRARASGTLQRQYTQLELGPEAMQTLRNIAVAATASARTDYDRVMALQRYIARTCRYNLEAPALENTDEDAVSQFLLRTREGYCDLFATSLAVLCRLMDIPARVASGFTSGEWDPTSMEYLVRAKDKHMWTEVYFEGVGWVPFEATAGTATARDENQTSRLRGGMAFILRLFKHGVLPPLLAGTSVLLIVYAVASEIRRRLRMRRAAGSYGGLTRASAEVLNAYAVLNRQLARRGLARAPTETPWEFSTRLSRAFRAAGADPSGVEELTELVVRARYAGEPMSAADAGRAQELVRGILRAIRVSAVVPVARDAIDLGSAKPVSDG